MEWSRSETLILASNRCAFCHGAGQTVTRRGASAPCHCVYRSIFRACYARFIYCASKEPHVTQSRYAATHGGGQHIAWGRKDEEYMADFCKVSLRHLDPVESRIFRFHFLLGADWKLCCSRLNLERGAFFHGVYRIQQRLGKVFRELRPYPLYPVEDYFYGMLPSGDAPAAPARDHGAKPLRPPVKKAA